MKSPLLCALLIAFANQAAAVEFTDNSPQKIGMRHTKRAVTAVVRHLTAPQTAKFRGLYLGTNPKQRGVVCGFVTARDRSGKMGDYQPFVYSPVSNDAVFMAMDEFRKRDVGKMNVSLFNGAGCGALLRL